MSVKIINKTTNGVDVLAISQLTGKSIKRGYDRKGVRAGDWVEETTTRRDFANPQIERAKILIETVAVIGADRLTAQDIAAHEYLLACAREQGIQKPVNEIPLKQLCAYLGITSAERAWDSLVRLQQTVIQYNIIDPITQTRVLAAMVRVSLSTDRKSGKTTVRYAIPGVVRRAILMSRSYTWLDINVFPRFKSKYAARLYTKLALLSGYDYHLRSWTPFLQELAVFIGYAGPSEDIHLGSFMRVLDKALEEIAEHVTRFEVVCVKPKRGNGRGRPVEGRFIFRVGDSSKELYACQGAYLPPSYVTRIEDRRYSPLDEHEHPTALMFAQAQTLTGVPAIDLSDAWRMNVAAARIHPERRFGAMTGRMLVSLIDDESTREAFKQWVLLAVQMQHLQDAVPEITPNAPVSIPGIATPDWKQEELCTVEIFDEDGEDLRIGDSVGEIGYKPIDIDFDFDAAADAEFDAACDY